MCERGTETVVATPAWLWEDRACPEAGIAVDSCMADELVAAWDAGLRTLGSCCGHGKEAPSVVLTEDPEQPTIARSLVSGWTLLQWRLTDVTPLPSAPEGDEQP